MNVIIPDALQSYTGAREVVAEGKTILAIFEDLESQYPGIRFRMINELDSVRPHFKLFINGDLEKNLSVAISATDELFIMQSLSGG